MSTQWEMRGKLASTRPKTKQPPITGITVGEEPSQNSTPFLLLLIFLTIGFIVYGLLTS